MLGVFNPLIYEGLNTPTTTPTGRSDMTTKEINQSMECIYDRPYVTAASVSKMEDRDWFFFQVTVDLGALDDGNGMSTIMSKKYDTYDDAVIAMNEHLEGVYSPV